ncbi:MAG: helix-turn-helix domain-containing protein [Pseudomonadota bacterium]
MAARKEGGGKEAALRAASALFYERGIPAVSVEQVAAEAGLTKRAVYYHFPTKADLVAAYLKAADEPAFSMLTGLTADVEPGLPTLRAAFDRLGPVLGAPTFRGCAFLRAARETKGGAEAATAHKERVREWFADQAKVAGLAEPDRIASALLLVLDGALSQATYAPSERAAAASKEAANAVLSLARRTD